MFLSIYEHCKRFEDVNKYIFKVLKDREESLLKHWEVNSAVDNNCFDQIFIWFRWFHFFQQIEVTSMQLCLFWIPAELKKWLRNLRNIFFFFSSLGTQFSHLTLSLASPRRMKINLLKRLDLQQKNPSTKTLLVEQ